MSTTTSFPSASNFRPLPRVRRGTLYRSDHLGALDADDARQILDLGLRRVLDFRGADERTSAACQLPGVAVHSLAIEPDTVPDVLEVTAATPGGVIMAVRHRSLPVEAVQFHPESVLTEGGYQMLANWLAICGDPEAPARAKDFAPLMSAR